jgi:signal transduction histidine kinase
VDVRRTAPLDELGQARAFVPLLAAVFVVTAAFTDPASWWRTVVLVVPVALFAAWYRWPVPTPVLAVGVVVTVAVAQWNGRLELSLFLVSLLALVAAAWEPRPAAAVSVVVVCVIFPAVLSLLRPTADIMWPPWTGGVIFPAAMGWTMRRQERLMAELVNARRELAEHAVLDERRRIAREVHDLVGHGLAAVMLQVTSARHVLRRSPDSADEALASAEEVGRRSLHDLRRTIGLLRDTDDIVGPRDGAGTGSLPSATRIAELVETWRDAGLDVSYDERGDVGDVDPVVGLTLYRVTQEALSNVGKHAPRSRTAVTLVAAPGEVSVEVDSRGARPPAPRSDGTAGHYGLQGMRERADLVGGRLTAGPTETGWLVRCAVPGTARLPEARQ